MPQLKTLPSAAVTSTVVSGGLPSLVPDLTYVGSAVTLDSDSKVLQGFAGDGDEIDLPIGTGNNLIYRDNTGSEVWSIAKTAIDGSVDNWVGMQLDKTDALLYLVGLDTGTGRFYLMSIDSAGTQVNIGDAIPSTAPGTAPEFTGIVTSSGASNITRTADGVGNLTVTMLDDGAVEELVIDITDGSIAVDTTVVAQMPVVPYKTARGIYVGGFGASTESETAFSNGTLTLKVDVGLNALNPNQGVHGLKPLQWNGRIVLGMSSGTSIFQSGVKACTVSAFEAWAEETARLIGVL